MATVDFVTAQFPVQGLGVTPTLFQVPKPATFSEQRALNEWFGSSVSDVLNRLQLPGQFGYLGGPSVVDVERVLILAFAGEMYPVRGPLTGDAHAAKIQRAMPYGQPPGAAYVSLAVKILQAYLFGIDSSQATWASS